MSKPRGPQSSIVAKGTIVIGFIILHLLSSSSAVINDKETDAAIKNFQIAVPTTVLTELQDKLRSVRWPDQLVDVKDWSMGTELTYLKSFHQYWTEKFNWTAVESHLNSFPQYTTVINGTKIHFIHVKSTAKTCSTSKDGRCIPLLFLHGWPGSFFECTKLIPLLTNEGGPGFDIVCPSLPGYGFSDAPKERGFGVRQMADTFAALMERLGYTQYLVQGGDWGSIIGTTLSSRHSSSVLGLHLNAAFVGPPYRKGFMGILRTITYFVWPTLFLTQDEVDAIKSNLKWIVNSGYFHEQATAPQTLAYGLTDSPLGLAAWILEKFYAWSDCNGNIESRFTKDDLLTNIMIYYVSGSIGSSMRLYYEAPRELPRLLEDYVSVPTAVIDFPEEIWRAPRSWLDYQYNITLWKQAKEGGHFAALEVPNYLAETIIEFASQFRSNNAPTHKHVEL